MATQKQIDANRRNAQKSTGPRTTAGKARTRLNAKTHGLTCQLDSLSYPERAEFEIARAMIAAGLAPGTAEERERLHEIAWNAWRSGRLRVYRSNRLACNRNALTGAPVPEISLQSISSEKSAPNYRN